MLKIKDKTGKTIFELKDSSSAPDAIKDECSYEECEGEECPTDTEEEEEDEEGE